VQIIPERSPTRRRKWTWSPEEAGTPVLKTVRAIASAAGSRARRATKV
jgi:hypothetical protein